jgi:hypothetical protein
MIPVNLLPVKSLSSLSFKTAIFGFLSQTQKPINLTWSWLTHDTMAPDPPDPLTARHWHVDDPDTLNSRPMDES